MTNDKLVIGNKKFSSRLFLGTGKFASNEIMQQVIASSETELVTIALKRLDLEKKHENIIDFIDEEKILILPNTSGANTAEEAVILAKLAYEAGMPKWVKLEIHPDPNYLLPDPIETLKAAEILVKEGYTVMPYINADPVLAKRLQDIGVATVMPLGSPIGSNNGLQTLEMIKIIIEQSIVPVVVDAGIGAPSDAAKAMEIGADAVLVNTALAVANNPVAMGKAFNDTVKAARLAYQSGLGIKSQKASSTSPLTSFLNQ